MNLPTLAALCLATLALIISICAFITVHRRPRSGSYVMKPVELPEDWVPPAIQVQVGRHSIVDAEAAAELVLKKGRHL